MSKLKGWVVVIIMVATLVAAVYNTTQVQNFMSKGGRFTQEEGDALEARIEYLEERCE